MGNTATKELETTQLGKCVYHGDGTDMSVHSDMVAKKSTKLTCKGDSYYRDDDESLLLKVKSEGLTGKRGTLTNAEGDSLAKIVMDWGIKSETTYVFRAEPSFEGQDPLSGDEMKKIKEPEDSALFSFAKIETKSTLTTATATYSVVSGKGDDGHLTFKPLYVAKKLSAMQFLAVVTLADDTNLVIGKAAMKGGMSFSVVLEVAEGADIAAVVTAVQAVFPGNSAGALAGAGVI